MRPSFASAALLILGLIAGLGVAGASALPALAGDYSPNNMGPFPPLPGAAPPLVTASCKGSQLLAFQNDGIPIAYDITLTGSCTFTLSAGLPGYLQTISLILRQSGSGGFVATFPAGIKWAHGGGPPSTNTQPNVIDRFTFSTPDAGATIFGDY